MQVTWIIERWIFDNSDNYQSELDLIAEIKKQGHNVEVIDAHKYDWRDRMYQLLKKNPYPEVIPTLFRGSLNVAREIYRSTSWTPGVYLGKSDNNKLTNFNCSTYNTYWGEYLLNNTYSLLPLQEVYRQYKNNKLFIRPDSGMKTFAGQVINLNESNKLKDIHPETLVLVDTVKPVSKEWRFVVCDNRIVTGCQYMKEGKYVSESSPEELNKVQDWLTQVLNKVKWLPDLIYTIDVCESEGTLYILELNSFSCSNFYSCDLSKIVEAANEVAIADWKEVYIYIS